VAERVLLAVFAHPDDETFRPGGTLALLARGGVAVHVLTATRGEAGSCGDPPLCTREELPGWRERELRCACRSLGIRPPRLLGFRDGCLAAANPDHLVAEILTAIGDTGASILLSFGPDGLSGHADHVAIGRCAAEAFDQATSVAALYTVAVPVTVARELDLHQAQAVPDAEIALAVDISPAWELKLAAMRCYTTQTSSTPLLQASLEVQRRFFGVEHFVRAALRRGCDDFFSDVLKGIPSTGHPEI
jgi:LmbE family N-acetylglucosaminyl deacetylase